MKNFGKNGEKDYLNIFAFLRYAAQPQICSVTFLCEQKGDTKKSASDVRILKIQDSMTLLSQKRSHAKVFPTRPGRVGKPRHIHL